MQVRISGKQMDIGAALPEAARSKLVTAIGKYFDGGAEANVVFSHEGVFYRADVTAHLDTGLIVKAEGVGSDAYLAFDGALERLEKQVRRYSGRLKNHHT